VSGDVPAGPIGVVADDLIWASRLTAAVERAGARPVRLGSMRALDVALEATTLAEEGDESVRLLGVVVDLNGRGYDGVDAVHAVAGARLPVIAVGQHEDLELRKRALAAGALRVFSYNKAFTDGAALVTSWLLRAAPRAAEPAR
jgi:CheY-like chemotaxis protein